jgi:hypothetical protein
MIRKWEYTMNSKRTIAIPTVRVEFRMLLKPEKNYFSSEKFLQSAKPVMPIKVAKVMSK